jgi:hypothetical protein
MEDTVVVLVGAVADLALVVIKVVSVVEIVVLLLCTK